jgi:hypothetical protein
MDPKKDKKIDTKIDTITQRKIIVNEDYIPKSTKFSQNLKANL